MTDAGADSGTPAADAGPLCGTATSTLPEGLSTLRYYDEGNAAHLGEQSWEVTVNGATIVFADSRSFEQARFAIDRPARIHGFRVRWADLPGETLPTDELAAGLYRDFGHNGFDMWQLEPLWTGTRCASDLDAEGWVTYAFGEPVAMDQPGLLYVGHERFGPGGPSFYFDLTTDDPENSCADFDHCRASVNFPWARSGGAFNGVTTQLPYDYLVELLVDYPQPSPRAAFPADGSALFEAIEGITLGNRVAFGDFDNDGRDDVLSPGPTLHRNIGGGRFEDVSDASGLAAVAGGRAGVWGDYDNDGCLDVFLFSESMTDAEVLMHGDCAGGFTDVTADSGIIDSQGYETCGDDANRASPTAAASWVDLDADGLLDLYLANFICWSSNSFYRNAVWHNLGAGRFEDWSTGHGFTDTRAPTRGVAPIDFDQDGDVDLFAHSYRLVQNHFFENLGGGNFEERAESLGIAGHASARGGVDYYGHTIGTAWGDLDNDGDFDVISANLAHPRFFDFSDKTQILLQNSAGTFEDITGSWTRPESESGLRYQETHSVPALADFDQDGILDLVITAIYDGRPTDFYWGRGDGGFTLDVHSAQIPTENGWGVATSDLDNDGDLDLATDGLFLNQAQGGHFLQVRVVGNVTANRAGIGAVVRIHSGSWQLIRQVQGGTGQGCQDSMYLHFGLGDHDTVERIEVLFPGGATQSYEGPFDADQRLWLSEDGSLSAGWAPPTGD